MDEVLSDREHGGFYASQDADISLDDDGDYFTWTLDEAEAVLRQRRTASGDAALRHWRSGEMHHNPAKNVLTCAPAIDEVAERVKKTPPEVQAILDSAKRRMYAARPPADHPVCGQTVYVGWNALCISAYLKAARVLIALMTRGGLHCARSTGFFRRAGPKVGLQRVLAYSDPAGSESAAFLACWKIMPSRQSVLDAYEASADLSYFHFAEKIAGGHGLRFHDPREALL